MVHLLRIRRCVCLLDFGADVSSPSAFVETLHELKGVPRRVHHTCACADLNSLHMDPSDMHKVTVLGTADTLRQARLHITQLSAASESWRRALVEYKLEELDMRRRRADAPTNSSETLASIRDRFTGRTLTRLREIVQSSSDRVLLGRLMTDLLQ